jgi:hypothetical protein
MGFFTHPAHGRHGASFATERPISDLIYTQLGFFNDALIVATP